MFQWKTHYEVLNDTWVHEICQIEQLTLDAREYDGNIHCLAEALKNENCNLTSLYFEIFQIGDSVRDTSQALAHEN
jgi:hypothetical protein